MRFIWFFSIALLCLVGTASLTHATLPAPSYAKATLLSDVARIHAGQKIWLALHLQLPEGWHSYWKNPGDSGTAPNLKWTVPRGFLVGETQYLPPHLEPIANLVDYGYRDEVWLLTELTAPVALNTNTTAIISLHAQWLVCKESCIPESGDFSLILPATHVGDVEPSEHEGAIAKAVSALPAALSKPISYNVSGNESEFSIPLPHSDKVTSAYFFSEQEGIIKNTATQSYQQYGNRLNFTLPIVDGAKPPASLAGVIQVTAENHAQQSFQANLKLSAERFSRGLQVWTSICLAFLGGLILNLMPCVFPILSLKALHIAKKSGAKSSHIRKQGIAYTLGVVVSFLALAGMVIALKHTGAQIGWGFQMQSPLFVSLLALLLFALGLNLSGVFEFPSLFAGIALPTGHSERWASFLTGMLAVAVATPCTAPFMASAIGFALTQSPFITLIVFLGLALGFAYPLLLLSLFPQLVRFLPKSGAWMEDFKQLLAFPLYFSAVWLAWVLTRNAGPDLLGILLCNAVLFVLAIWLLQHRAGFWQWLGKTILVGILIIMIAATHIGNAPVTSASHEKFSMEKLEELRKAGTPVFVDVTADWCITCKINENFILSSANVKSLFAHNAVTVLVADWTRRDAHITEYLQSFERSGVPLYVYYPPTKDPVLLPQLLTSSIIAATLEHP